MEWNKLPDDAALREVFEETGLQADLVGDKRKDLSDPVQLHHPPGCSSRTVDRDISK